MEMVGTARPTPINTPAVPQRRNRPELRSLGVVCGTMLDTVSGRRSIESNVCAGSYLLVEAPEGAAVARGRALGGGGVGSVEVEDASHGGEVGGLLLFKAGAGNEM